MIRLLSLAVMACAVAAAQSNEPKKLANIVPGDCQAFVFLDVAKAWDHPALGAVREANGKLEFAWAVQSVLGTGPRHLERITAFWIPASKETPLILMTGRQPLDARGIARKLRKPGAKATTAKPPENVFAAPGAEFALVMQVDPRTVLLAPDTVDPAKLEGLARGTPGRLSKAIAAAGNHTLTIGLDVQSFAQLPLPVGAPLLEGESAVLTADLAAKANPDTESVGKAEFRLQFAGDAAARKAAPLLKAKLDELAGWSAAQAKRVAAKEQQGSGYPAPLLEWIAKTLKGAKVKVDGRAAVAAANLNVTQGIAALMTALPDSTLTNGGYGRSVTENNMKQIILAFHNYADANGRCVSNSYDKDGKPLLSSRVHLLPYIEQQALYNQFKLNEPWDSPHNKSFSETVVKVFQVSGRPSAKPWETYFRGFIGPKKVSPEHRPWLLEGETKGPNFPANFPDGTSTTWLVVEAADSVPWAKPDDLVYDGKLPLPKFGGPNGSFTVGFADGSVRTFRRGQLTEQTTRYLISVADDMPVNLPR